jgi:hypothetical protein
MKKDLICKFLQSGSLYACLNVLFTCSIIIKPIEILLYSISKWVAGKARFRFDLGWIFYYSSLFCNPALYSMYIKCFVYIQYYELIKPIAILLLLDFWVSCGSSGSDPKPDFGLIWAEYSVILLFFSKIMKKKTLFASFCNLALMYFNKRFVYYDSVCMDLLFLARLRSTFLYYLIHAWKIEKIVISITCLIF